MIYFPQSMSTNKTDCHDITEILLKVAVNTIKPNQTKEYDLILSLMNEMEKSSTAILYTSVLFYSLQ